MIVDALAFEPQFLDHLAPVWNALPPSVRGTFHVDDALVERAQANGVEAVGVSADRWRREPQHAPVHDGIPTLVASIGDIKIGRRMGHGPYAFLEHGAGQSYGTRQGRLPNYAGGPGRDDNELFLVPNEYSYRLWCDAYPEARTEIVGCPRLDGLPPRQGHHIHSDECARAEAERPEGTRPESCVDFTTTVAISFHGDWPAGVPYGGNALPDFAGVLGDLAKAYTVIGHAHPGKGWGDKLSRLYARNGIEFVPDFDDVCRRADVYVCDNSSTIFEFASTGRPVVLLNARHWHKGHGPGLRFWDAAHVGVNVDKSSDLIDAVAVALRDAPHIAAAREDALRFVYTYRTGGAERAADAVTDWLIRRAGIAA